MEIRIVQADPAQRKAKPTDETKLGFGKVFTDHMFTMSYQAGRGWYEPMVRPYENLALDPAAMTLLKLDVSHLRGIMDEMRVELFELG